MKNKVVKRVLALTTAAAVMCTGVPAPAMAAGEPAVPDTRIVEPQKTAEALTAPAVPSSGTAEGTDTGNTGNPENEAPADSRTSTPAAEGQNPVSPDSPGVYITASDTGALIDPSLISVTLPDGTEAEWGLNEDGGIVFGDAYNGSTVRFTVRSDTYKTVSWEEVCDTSAVSETAVTLTEKEETLITAENVRMEYGDTLSAGTLGISTNTEEPLEFELLSGGDAVTVTQDGEITAVGTGTAEVAVKAPAGDNYTEGSAVFTVEAVPKDLGVVNAADITFESLEKMYDGSDTAEVFGTIRTDGTVPGLSEIRVRAVLQLDGANAGEHTGVITQVAPDGEEDRAVFTAGEPDSMKVTGFTVNPYPVAVIVRDREVVYGTNDWAALTRGETPESWNTGSFEAVTDDNAVKEAAESAMNAGGHAEITVQAGDYTVGTYTAAAVPRATDPDLGNFLMVIGENAAGTVTVVPETVPDEELWARISTDGSEGGVFRNGDTVYVRPGSVLRAQVTDTPYDRAVFIQDGQESTDSYRIPDTAKDGSITTEYHLALSTDSTGLTRTTSVPGETAENRIPEGAVIVDGTAPAVTVSRLPNYRENGETVLSWFISLFANGKQEVDVKIGESGSGLKSAQYKVVTVTGKQEADRAALEAASDEDRSGWADVPEDGKITVEKPSQGICTVIVRAEDNVGNVMLATSEGAVIDTDVPNAEVTGIDSTAVYTKDVEYGLHVEDPTDGPYSGIKEIDVSVLVNGTPIRSKTIRNASDALTDSYTIPEKVISEITASGDGAATEEKEGPDENDIKRTSEGFSLSGKITAKKANSNDVVLRVTVTDRAGNTYTHDTKLRINATRATVEASLSGEPVNGSYFNEARTMTLSFNARNFDPERTAVVFTVDGKKGTYTAESLAEADGIRFIGAEDSEKDLQETEHTDDRVVTYTYAVGEGADIDRTYALAVSYTGDNGKVIRADMEDCDKAFTIDKIAPEASCVLTNGAGEELAYPADQTAPCSNTGIQGTVTVQDNHFDAASSTVNGTENGAWDGNAYSWTWTEDGMYTVSAVLTDMAGNRTSIGGYSACVDTEAPTGAVREHSGDTLFTRFLDKVTKFLFSNRDLTFTVEDAADGLSGVAEVSYYTDTDKGASERVLTVEELRLMPWQEYTGAVTVPADREAMVYAKITDRAGNETYINTDGIILDSETAGAPEITIEADRPESGFYTEDIPFRFTVTEPENNGAYAGLEQVTWYVVADGKTTQSETIDLTSPEDPLQRTKSYTGSGSITAAKNEAEEVRLIVKATDRAGNVSTASFGEGTSVDVTPPEVLMEYDNNNAENDIYFKAPRTAELRISDRHFTPDGARFEVAVDGNTKVCSAKELADGAFEEIHDVTLEEQDGIWVFRAVFGGKGTDSSFVFRPIITDSAGHTARVALKKGTAAPYSFSIDAVRPSAKVTYEISSGLVKSGSSDRTAPVYDRVSVVPVLTVTDGHLKQGRRYGQVMVSVKGSDADGKYIRISPEMTAEASSLSNWTFKGNTASVKMPAFTQDANYALDVTVTDLAGNAVTIDTDYFTVDGTAPQGTIKDTKDGNIFRTLASVLKGFIFSDTDIEFKIDETDDRTSGIASVSYYIDSGDRPLTAEELGTRTFLPYEDTVLVKKEGQGVVYARIEDKAGNVSWISSSRTAVADTTAPNAPVITIATDGTPGKKFYTGDVPFTVHVEDPVSGGTYSGLADVSWYVVADGEITQPEEENRYTDEFSDKDRRIREYDFSGTVLADRNDANEIYVFVRAVDNAGNETVTRTSEPVSIDTTAPALSVAFDRNDPANGRYFNSGRVMEVTVTERNFDPSGFSLALTANGVAGTYSLADISAGRAEGVTVESAEEDAENGIYVYRIGFGMNGTTDCDYTAVPQVVDLAGNTDTGAVYADGTAAGIAFTVDEIAPVVTASYAGGTSAAADCSTDASNPTFDRSQMTVSISAEERNLIAGDARGSVSVALTATDAAGNAVDAYPGQDISAAEDLGSWSRFGNTHTKQMAAFTNDANYAFGVSVTDLAGNTSAPYATRYFTIDRTPPAGSISTGAQGLTGLFTQLYNLVRFWFYSNTDVGVERTAEDATSGVASIRYYIWEPGAESRGTFSGLDESQLSNVNWTDWDAGLRLTPDTGAIVYERIEDRAGNVTYINTEGGIITEGTAPSQPEIVITTAEPRNGIYSGDVAFTLQVTDPMNGGTYSGLRSVSWQVTNNGTVTQSGSYDAELEDRTARVQTVTKSELIDAQLNNSNHVRITVTATDYSGNTSTAYKDIMIDITAPQIEIVYDNNSPMNGRYYNTVRTATVLVTERNFDPSDFSLNISETRQAVASVGNWVLASDMGETDSATSTCTVVFADDGDYTVSASARDRAGNQASYNRTDNFVIDRTAPTVEVSFDNTAAQDGKYYNTPRNAFIRVNDRFMNASDISTDSGASLDGQAFAGPTVGTWTQDGDSMTGTVAFTEDGDYILRVNATDLAGNRALTYQASAFTLDRTAPELEFFNIGDRTANRGAVQPGISFGDRNFLPGEVSITVRGARHDAYTPSGVRSDTATGGTFVLDDFSHTPEKDDLYTLTAVIRDRAGNITEKSLTFSVNRFGSVYSFDKVAKEMLETYYLKECKAFTVYETNADRLTEQKVIVSRNGEIIDVVQGRDYTVTDITDDGDAGWRIYAYTFNGDAFRAEGLYEIRISSLDEAGNEQDNQLKDDPITFVVDRTAPTVSFSGITDGGRYSENSHAFEVIVSDNFAFGSVTLTANGKTVKVFTAEEIRDAGGRLACSLDNADDWQEVTVTAEDAAGNVSDGKSIRVLITSNPFLQFIANRPLLYGSLGGVAALLGILLFLIFRKKKKDSDDGGESEHTDDL